MAKWRFDVTVAVHTNFKVFNKTNFVAIQFLNIYDCIDFTFEVDFCLLREVQNLTSLHVMDEQDGLWGGEIE